MRTVRFEEEFSNQIRRLRIDVRRLDEALESLIDVLSNAPELFLGVPGTPLRRAKISEGPGLPALTVFFLFDDENVYLMSAERIDESE